MLATRRDVNRRAENKTGQRFALARLLIYTRNVAL
jgi:hypothetical protein